MSNPDDNKPKEWREWVIAKDHTGQLLFNENAFELACALCPGREIVHVIEHAALTQAEAAIEQQQLIIAGYADLIDAHRKRADEAEREIAELRNQLSITNSRWPYEEKLAKQNEEQAKEIEKLKTQLYEFIRLPHRQRERELAEKHSAVCLDLAKHSEMVAVLETALENYTRNRSGEFIKGFPADEALAKLKEYRSGK